MSYLPDERVTDLVIHYSATPIETDFSIADIDRSHRQRGFNEVGYHYYIRKSGYVQLGRDLSQPGRFEVGAHSKGENSVSIGICYEGGVTQSNPDLGFDTRTPEQIEAMIRIIDQLLVRFPGARVRGHRDMPGAATQCPGFDATAWWDSVVKERNDPKRKSITESTTLQACATVFASSGAGVMTAFSKLDPMTQYILIATFVVSLFGLYWIARERIRKWGKGDR